MDIIEKARELGKMIGESEQFIRMQNAEDAQMNDAQAQELIKSYNEKRSDIGERMKSESLEKNDMIALRQELQNEFNKLMENEVIFEYIEAKKEYEQLMKSVNDVITYSMTGEESSDCSSGGGCSSCSGCH